MNTEAKQTPAEAAAAIRAMCEERIATADMYLGRTALVSHNWAVVSSLWNGRGVYLTNDPTTGERLSALGPYPNHMPTLYGREDADALASEWAGQIGETLRVVDRQTWWQTERDEAASMLQTLAVGGAA